MKRIKILVILLLLIRLAWIDQREYKIPRRYLQVALGGRTILAMAELMMDSRMAWKEIMLECATAVFVMVLLTLLRCLSKGGIGIGDIRLLGVMAFFLGFSLTLKTFFCAMIVAFFQGIFSYGIFRKKKIPFVPALLGGMIAALLL